MPSNPPNETVYLIQSKASNSVDVDDDGYSSRGSLKGGVNTRMRSQDVKI